VALVLLVGIFLLSPTGEGRLRELGSTVSFSDAGGGQTTNSLDWRLYNWNLLIDVWRTRPLLGAGAGTTVELVAPANNLPHSDPLRLLVETGVAGTIVFGAFVAWWLHGVWQARRLGADPELRALAAPVLALVIGLIVNSLVSNITLDTAPMYSIAALVGLVLGRTEHVPLSVGKGGGPSASFDSAGSLTSATKFTRQGGTAAVRTVTTDSANGLGQLVRTRF